MVAKASPTLATSASADVTIGGQVSDTATIASGYSPGGQITFKAYGPNDADCSGVAAFTDTEPVTGNGAYVSADFTPTQPGTYRWTAHYSGDANNNIASTACNAPGESVLVGSHPDADDLASAESRSARPDLANGYDRRRVEPRRHDQVHGLRPGRRACSRAAAFIYTKTSPATASTSRPTSPRSPPAPTAGSRTTGATPPTTR